MGRKKGKSGSMTSAGEMVQSALDRLIGGRIDEDAFLEELRGFDVSEERLRNALIARLSHNDEEFAPLASFALKQLQLANTVRDLQRIYFDGTPLTDRIRLWVIDILSEHGVNTSQGSYYAEFDDLDEALLENERRILQSAVQNEAAIPDALSRMNRMESDVLVGYVYDLQALAPEEPGAILFLKYLAWSERREVALAAVESISEIASDDVALCLLQVATSHPRQDVRASARSAATRHGLLATEISRAPLGEPLGEVDWIGLSAFERNGSRMLWIVRRASGRYRNRYNFINFCLDLSEGVRSAHGDLLLTEDEVHELLSRQTGGIRHSLVQYDFARRVFGEAMARNGDHTPFEIAYWRHKAFEIDTYPCDLTFAFPDEVDLEAISHDEELLANTELVLDSDETASWSIFSPEGFDFVDGHADLLNLEEKPPDEYNRMLIEFADNVFPSQRKLYVEMLLKVAEIFHLGSDQGKRDLALAAAHHLGEGTRPAHEQPFVRALSEQSIEGIHALILRGIDIRQDPELFDTLV